MYREVELKPCFCGGEVFVVNSKITPGGTAWLNLQCRMCGAVIKTSLDYWNTRPIENELIKALEISISYFNELMPAETYLKLEAILAKAKK